MRDCSVSDGTTASYYQLPEGCTELQDLISYRNMNAQDGEIFRAIYRKGRASHSDELRDARKVLFYAQAEVKRLEALQPRPVIRELYTAHPTTPNVWETGEQRMEQIGTNGNDGEHYAASDDGWVPHEGGVCPTDPRATVRVMMRDGVTDINLADSFRWNHMGNVGDIVKYRLWSPGLK